MKNRVFATISLATLLTAAGASAQSGALMHVDIPFEFRVGKNLLPPGHYDVRPEVMGGVLSLNCYACRAAAMVQTNGIQGNIPEIGKLVFHRYGDKYFLWTVWTAGYSQGRELRMSEPEREISGGAQPATVTQVAHTPR